jgi:hypothetical protein
VAAVRDRRHVQDRVRALDRREAAGVGEAPFHHSRPGPDRLGDGLRPYQNAHPSPRAAGLERRPPVYPDAPVSATRMGQPECKGTFVLAVSRWDHVLSHATPLTRKAPGPRLAANAP